MLYKARHTSCADISCVVWMYMNAWLQIIYVKTFTLIFLCVMDTISQKTPKSKLTSTIKAIKHHIYAFLAHSSQSQSFKNRPLFTFLVRATGATIIISFHALLFSAVQRPTSVGCYMNYMRQHVCHHNREVNFYVKMVFTHRIVVFCLFAF